MKLIPEADAAFWSRVDKSGDCWVWQQRSGPATTYGSWRGSPANRVALNFREPLPKLRRRLDPGERSHWQALHHCDNPPCVNPDHLYWGTSGRNAEDRKQRHPKCEYVSVMWGKRCRGTAAHDLGDVWACGPHRRLVIAQGRVDIPTIHDHVEPPRPALHLAVKGDDRSSYAACGRWIRSTSAGPLDQVTCRTCLRSLAYERAERKKANDQ